MQKKKRANGSFFTQWLCQSRVSAYISNVLGVREVGEISIVEFLTFQIAAVVPRLQIAGFDAIGLKKLLVGHSKSLTDRLGDNLSLVRTTKIIKVIIMSL